MTEGEEIALVKILVSIIRRHVGGRTAMTTAVAFNRLFDMGILERVYKLKFGTPIVQDYQVIVGITKSGTVVTDLKASAPGRIKPYLSEYNTAKAIAISELSYFKELKEINDKIQDSLDDEFVNIARDYVDAFISDVKRRHGYVINSRKYAYRCFMTIRKLTRVLTDLGISDINFSYVESDNDYKFVFMHKGKPFVTYILSKEDRSDKFISE